MGKIIFITGGARNGKSQYAVKLVERMAKDTLFLATCIPRDEEMRKRVKEHKEARPVGWKTIEEERDLIPILKKADNEVVIIDCLTLLISNLLLEKEQDIEDEIEGIAHCIRQARYTAIMVSNEVGSGIVPDNELARRFRDITGWANQLIVQYAEEVYLMVAGMPIKIK